MNNYLSKHFKRSEFACKCGCGFNTVDTELFGVLTVLRKDFDSPVIITSGARCIKHNGHVDGKQKSYHLLGQAVDFYVRNIKPEDVYSHLVSAFPHCYGIGLYSGWVHLDIRAEPARWGMYP